MLGAAIEVGSWVLATFLLSGSWRYNISALYAAGAPRPWLVMAGQAAFAVAVAALAVGLRRSLPRSDHRMVGCALLALASVGAVVGALARNACEESVPRCEGQAFVTVGDWVHGIASLLEFLGIAGAALVLAAALPRRWAAYSAATGCAVFVADLRLAGHPLSVGRHGRTSPRPAARLLGRRDGHPTHRWPDDPAAPRSRPSQSLTRPVS